MPLLIKTTGFEEFLDPSGGAYIKALIMGDHGVGKTPSACCWPKPILADCEKGRMSVASMGVPYADIKTSADMDALLDMLRIDCMKPATSRKYQTLVIDTVDSYQRKLIQERLKSERKENLSGWADWGWLDGKMILLIERLLNLPMNVVVNMHIKDVTVEDGDESRLVQKARLKGDIKDAIFQDFDLIGRMEQSYVAGSGAQKGERVRVRQIRWHSEPMYPSLRDRSNKLPRFTDVDFSGGDFQRIFDAITSGLDDLPASTDLETLPTEGDGEAPAADVEGGPVEAPKLPQPKPAKKAAAAKKAPAKKAAAPEPAEVPAVAVESETAGTGEATNAETGEVTAPGEPLPEGKSEDAWAPPEGGYAEDDKSGDAQLDRAVNAVREELGGEVIATESTPVVEDPPAEPAVADLTPPPVVAPVAKTAKHCGDQPPSMVGKKEPLPGCGRVLTQENAGKSTIAVIKFATYLCDDDFAAQMASA